MALTAVLLDLDETLYPPGEALIRTIDARITAFIVMQTGLPWKRADRLRVELWRVFGTTARGLNRLLDVSERDLNRFAVNAVDPASYLQVDPSLAHHLKSIGLPCHLFTNAPLQYAQRVLLALGVRDCIGEIFGIEFSLFNPKPSPIAYRRVVAALGLAPQEVVFVDDNPRNLIPALDMGMCCVCVGNDAVPAGAIQVANLAEACSRLRSGRVSLSEACA